MCDLCAGIFKLFLFQDFTGGLVSEIESDFEARIKRNTRDVTNPSGDHPSCVNLTFTLSEKEASSIYLLVSLY